MVPIPVGFLTKPFFGNVNTYEIHSIAHWLQQSFWLVRNRFSVRLYRGHLVFCIKVVVFYAFLWGCCLFIRILINVYVYIYMAVPHSNSKEFQFCYFTVEVLYIHVHLCFLSLAFLVMSKYGLHLILEENS